MIGNQKQKDEGYVNVGTKVPPHVAEFLNFYAAIMGTDIYGVLQMFIHTIYEAAKCETELDPHTKLLLHMLEADRDWCRAFNFASPSAMSDVAQVILVVQQYDGKGSNRQPRKGYGLVMIDKPALPGSKPKVTRCVDTILERVMSVSMAGLFRKLDTIRRRMKDRAVRETLLKLCETAAHQLDIDEIQEELPQIGTHHDFGKIIEWGNKYKQRKHRTPDSLANSQMHIVFDDDDRETADREADYHTAEEGDTP